MNDEFDSFVFSTQPDKIQAKLNKSH